MEVQGGSPERPFEYGVWLESLNTFLLQKGDLLYIISMNGSIYEFKVISKEGNEIIIKCTRGSISLQNSQGNIRNPEIRVGKQLEFGETSHTSIIRYLICSKTEMNFSFKDVKYGVEVEEVDARKLKPGDYIHAEDEKGTIYIYKVVGFNKVTKEPILELVLIRFSNTKDRLCNCVLGSGYRIVGGEKIMTNIIKRIMITQSPDEVFHQGEESKPANLGEQSQPPQRKWLPEDVMVSGTGLPSSIPAMGLLKELRLDPDNYTQEELDIAWRRHLQRQQILAIGYETLRNRGK